MLKIEDITYNVEGRPLFEGASATIPTGHKVGLVGRNGAGKTTLISEWRATAAGRDFPFACLCLDPDDNDPTRFLTYLAAALGTLQPGLGETALAMLRSPQPPTPPAILTILINDLDRLKTPFALVLDDYHVIAAQPIQEAITFLLDHRPPQMRLVLLTRADPFGQLARHGVERAAGGEGHDPSHHGVVGTGRGHPGRQGGGGQRSRGERAAVDHLGLRFGRV